MTRRGRFFFEAGGSVVAFVRAVVEGVSGGRVGRSMVRRTKGVLGRKNLITFPARAICKLKTSTLGRRTTGGACTTGKHPSSGPLVIRVTSCRSLGGITIGVPPRASTLTTRF